MKRERTWLGIGKDLVERLTQRSVENKIKNLRWRTIPTDGSRMDLPFSPGEAIKTAIKEFGLPKVSAIAIDSFSRPEFYPSFYGIESNYKNGRARLYLLDDGVTLTPLASDFWPATA